MRVRPGEEADRVSVTEGRAKGGFSMERVWTEEQERVISHRGGNLLVAAAAGSGKTAVLVEHVISLLTEGEKPASLSELLIMTFTESAAAEMKERIRLSLEERLRKDPENGRLIREAGNLQNANISTIDSFCRRLILENYASIDLDPSFRVGEEGELRLLRSDLVTELLEEHYESCDPGYLRFLENFTRGKDDAGIEELILMSIPRRRHGRRTTSGMRRGRTSPSRRTISFRVLRAEWRIFYRSLRRRSLSLWRRTARGSIFRCWRRMSEL